MEGRVLEASVSLFGMIGELDQTKTLLSLICLIVILLLFDTFLEMVEYFAEDSGYGMLLQKLYKEMMIMGCISFSVFIIFNSPLEAKHDENYLAFEFAHIILFFLAFFFVLRACIAVHYTRQAKLYFQKAQNTSALKLCERFIEFERSPYSLKALTHRYLGLMSNVERTFQYRVLEDFFFKEFPLMPEEFRFVDYLSKSFKFYTIEMVEIEPRSWFFLVFLLLLNYFRLSVMGGIHSHDLCYDYHHKDDKGYDDDHRRLAGAGEEEEVLLRTCPDYVMWYAITVGCVLVVATLIVCVISHLQKERLLSLAGAGTVEGRLQKLKDFQNKENDEIEQLREFEQLSVELSTRVNSRSTVWQKLGRKISNDGSGNSSPVPTDETTDQDGDSKMSTPRKHLVKQESILHKKNSPDRLRLKENHMFDEDNKYYVSTLVIALGAVQRQHLLHHQEFAHGVLFWLKSILSCFVWNCCTYKEKTKRPQINEKLLEVARNMRRGKSNVKGLEEEGTRNQANNESTVVDSVIDSDDVEDEELLSHPLLKNINSIFFFGSRNVYKYFIQLILMLDAFYLSVYATNLISVSLESERPILFNVLMVATILIMTALSFYLLVISSILFCVTSLHNKGTTWMCEQEDMKRRTLPILRREMLTFVDNSEDVKSFFSLLSGGGDIMLTDFSNFLFTLGIHPSQKEIRALFRAVDADSSGSIDLEELEALLFDPTKKTFGRSLDDSHRHYSNAGHKVRKVKSFADGQRDSEMQEESASSMVETSSDLIDGNIAMSTLV